MKSYQLFLTSLDKDFNQDRTPLFLGDWCLRYKDQAFWDNVEYEMSSDVWEKYNVQRDIDAYCLDLISRLILELAETLNIFHKENGSIKYWSFVLLTWLYTYVYKWFQCYMEVTNVIGEFSDLKVNILKMNEMEGPFNESNIVIDNGSGGEVSDIYYWSIYSKIIKDIAQERNIQIEEIDYRFQIVKKNALLESSKGTCLKERMKGIYLWGSKKAPIYFYNFIGGKNLKKIRRENLGRVRFSDTPKVRYNNEYNLNDRKRMRFGFKPKNKFEEILKKNILYDIPEHAVEDYKDFVQFRENNLQTVPKIVITQSSSISDEEGVFFAEWYEKGVEFFFITHNIISALIKKNTLETVFLLGCKKYSWGNSHDIRNVVCPSFKDYEFEKQRVTRKGAQQILWCGSGLGVQGVSRELYQLAYKRRKERKEAIDNDIICLSLLNEKIKEHVLYRPRDVANFGMEEVFKTYIPDLRIDKAIENGLSISTSVRKSLSDRLEESRLIICESLMTSVFYEALNMNIPVIVIERDVYSEVSAYNLYEDVVSYFQELKKVGIWYESGEEAACFINENYNGIDEWWFMPERQHMRKRMLERFFMSTKDLPGWWKKEFKRLLSELRNNT